MNYKYLTQDEMDDHFAAALLDREREHFHYQTNIDNFNDMITALDVPEEWPEELKKYQGLSRDQTAAALDLANIAPVVKLQQRDMLRHRIKAEVIEQSIVELAIAALEKRLPAVRRDAAIGRVRAKLPQASS